MIFSYAKILEGSRMKEMEEGEERERKIYESFIEAFVPSKPITIFRTCLLFRHRVRENIPEEVIHRAKLRSHRDQSKPSLCDIFRLITRMIESASDTTSSFFVLCNYLGWRKKPGNNLRNISRIRLKEKGKVR